MKPTFLGLAFYKSKNIIQRCRIMMFKFRGLQIGKGSVLGKITCDWPNKLIIGNFGDIQDAVDFKIWHPYNNDCYITVGNNVFIGHACEFVCNSSITIGNNCLIASNTTFNDTGHEYSKQKKIREQAITTKAIILNDDVWIGTSCVVLQGVTIGEGAIIGAGSVVNKSIPPYEIWAGVPARFIKKRE